MKRLDLDAFVWQLTIKKISG